MTNNPNHPPIPPGSERFQLTKSGDDAFNVAGKGWIAVVALIGHHKQDCANCARCAWLDEYKKNPQLYELGLKINDELTITYANQAIRNANAWALWGRGEWKAVASE